MPFEKAIHLGRTEDFTLNLFDADGAEVDLADGDVVRVKVGRLGGEPILDLGSDAATASHSSIMFQPGTNTVTLRFAQGDTASLYPGAYRMEIDVVDISETAPANAIKFADEGVLHLIDSLGGQTGT